MILRAGNPGGVLLDAAALHFLDLLDHVQLDAVLVVDVAVGVAHGDHLRAHLRGLFTGIDGHVAAAADHHGLAGQGLAVGLQHVLDEIAQAVAGGLRPGQTAAVGQTLAGEHAFIQAGDALVLAVQIADLPAAHADVARRHVRVRADVAVQLGHQALAKGHDLPVALALGVEVAAALAAADGQAGQAVLQNLLKAEEFQNGQVDAGMEPQTALVGADGAVELHPVAPVHLHLALIVHPGDAEKNDPLRLHEPLQQTGLFVLGMLVKHGGNAFQDFRGRLQKFAFVGVALLQPFQNAGSISVHIEYPFLFSRAPCPLPSGPRRFAPSHESPSLYHKPGARYALRVHLVCIFLRPYRDRGTVKACSGSCSIRPSWWEMTSVLA